MRPLFCVKEIKTSFVHLGKENEKNIQKVNKRKQKTKKR